MSTKLSLLMYLQDTNVMLTTILNNIKEFQVHEINQSRSVLGEYHHLFPVLKKYPDKFFKYVRMNTVTFNYLLMKIEPSLTKNGHNYHHQAILPEERLVVTIRFLATGMSYADLGFTFRMGTSTVKVIIQEVMEALWSKLYPLHMPIPTQEKFLHIAEQFYTKWDFPHCIGAIDCQHIRIKKPAHSGSKFYNYKKFCSIVLQALVDANCRFIGIDVGGYGQQSDAGTFYGSTLYAALKTNKIRIPESDALPNSDIKLPFFIVGDGAYPLMENLMKPYPGTTLPAYAEIFNKRLSRARVCVERAFGLMSQKWRIFHKRIEQTPETVNLIIKCACLLHNVIIDKETIDEYHCDDHLDNSSVENSFLADERENDFEVDYGKQVRYELTKWVLQNHVHETT